MDDPTPRNESEKTRQPLNIILVGSGGVGTIAALTLSKSGKARITTVLRSKYEVVNAQGWDIDSVDHGTIKGWRSDRGEYFLFVQV